MKRAIVLMLLGLALAGCAALKWQENKPLFQAVTEAVVARMLTEKPAWAEPTYRIAGVAKNAAETGKLVTVRALADYTVSLVPMKDLLPEEQTLVRAVIGQVAVSLEDRFELQGITDPSKQLIEAVEVLGWVQGVAARRRAP